MKTTRQVLETNIVSCYMCLEHASINVVCVCLVTLEPPTYTTLKSTKYIEASVLVNHLVLYSLILTQIQPVLRQATSSLKCTHGARDQRTCYPDLGGATPLH